MTPNIKYDWNTMKSSQKRAILKARQGVKYPSLEFLDVKVPRIYRAAVYMLFANRRDPDQTAIRAV